MDERIQFNISDTIIENLKGKKLPKIVIITNNIKNELPILKYRFLDFLSLINIIKGAKEDYYIEKLLGYSGNPLLFFVEDSLKDQGYIMDVLKRNFTSKDDKIFIFELETGDVKQCQL